MRTRSVWRVMLGLAAAGMAPLLLAADHRDGAAVTNVPAADLTDLFAWMSPDASRVNLVLDVFPDAAAGARFSDAIQYVFHVESRSGVVTTSGEETRVVCTFDADERVSCWVGDDAFVTGDARGANGIASDDGRLRVFTGPRNDPSFFNLDGFRKVAADVTASTDSFSFDANGCPALDAQTSTDFVTQLASDPNGAPATDDFAGQNVLSIVVSVDKALLTGGGPLLAVWASTHRAP